MKKALLILILVMTSLSFMAQEGATHYLVSADSIRREYFHRQIPKDIKDRVKHILKNKVYFRARNASSERHKFGSVSQVTLVYEFDNSYLLYFVHYAGRTQEHRIIVFDKNNQIIHSFITCMPIKRSSRAEMVKKINDCIIENQNNKKVD
jgi:hypothetical protein